MRTAVSNSHRVKLNLCGWAGVCHPFSSLCLCTGAERHKLQGVSAAEDNNLYNVCGQTAVSNSQRVKPNLCGWA